MVICNECEAFLDCEKFVVIGQLEIIFLFQA